MLLLGDLRARQRLVAIRVRDRLALNADLGPQLWPLFLFPAATAALSGIDSSARNAMLPGLVGMELLPASNAIFQSLAART